jgi:MYXO-CTERM domain-containing protein
VAGAAGTCTPVVGAPHGAREACRMDDASNPCSQRICDGDTRTTCAGFVGTERACREASCASGTAILPASCNGKGACPETQQAECGKYACAGALCGKAPCSSSSECAAGFRCDDGLKDCVPLDSAICDRDRRTLRSPDGTTEDCSPYVCEGDRCKASCTSTADCLSGHVCDSASKNCVVASAGGAEAESGGCGCRVPGSSGSGHAAKLALALLVALIGVRRRARRAS